MKLGRGICWEYLQENEGEELGVSLTRIHCIYA